MSFKVTPRAAVGASGVTGAGFITLAATLQSVPGIPIESLAILVGIDRFMSECRALTNLIGNGVATVAISRWEKELTAETLNANLRHPFHIELVDSEEAVQRPASEPIRNDVPVVEGALDGLGVGAK